MSSKIKGYRVMLGLNQKDMGELFGISPQAYSMKERGLTSFTDEEKIILVELIKKVAEHETVESIFFSKVTTK